MNKGDVLIVRQLAALCGHDARGHRVVETEGTADGGDPFSDLKIVAVAHLQNRQIFGVDLYDGNVGFGIASQDLALKFPVVRETNHNGVRTVHDVMVREDEAVGADDEAGSRAALFRHFAGAAERKGHRETEPAEDFRALFIHAAEGIGTGDLTGFAYGGNVDDALAVFLHEIHEVGELSAHGRRRIGRQDRRGHERRAGNQSSDCHGSGCGLQHIFHHFLFDPKKKRSSKKYRPSMNVEKILQKTGR